MERREPPRAVPRDAARVARRVGIQLVDLRGVTVVARERQEPPAARDDAGHLEPSIRERGGPALRADDVGARGAESVTHHNDATVAERDRLGVIDERGELGPRHAVERDGVVVGQTPDRASGPFGDEQVDVAPRHGALDSCP